ncbi:MAG: hypothetical protein IIB02_06555 [Thaumarchaeota archaeon]|nr:hypothetical protein [Nitrososphaerota archaeon]
MKLRAVQDDFVDVLDGLSDGPIKTAVQDTIADLKQDKILGEHVKKNQIPKYYITRHNIPILYRHALPNRWRLIYSIMEFEVKGELGVLMLELMDHNQYNKRFGYYKKKSA